MSFKSLEKVLTSTNAEPLSPTNLYCSQFYAEVKRSNGSSMEWSARDAAGNPVAAGAGNELFAPAYGSVLPHFSLNSNQHGGNNINLADIYLLGTTGDGVNITYEEY
jgi:hypothetical protein